MRKVNPKVLTVTFCGLVMVLMLWVFYTVYRDALRESVQCSKKQSVASSYLILRSLNGGANQLKSGLSILQFEPESDSLEFNTVTQGRTLNQRDYDAVLKVSPSPSPEPSASPAMRAERKPWDLNLPYSSRPFFYPFEVYVVNIQLDFRRNGKEVPVSFSVINHIDQAVIEKCVVGYSFDETTSDSNSITLVLRRHRFIQIAAVVLYSVAFIFLFYIATRVDSTTVLANSLGYLAALWGVRGIIVGPTNLFPTLIDVITLSLYVIVGAIVIFKWLLAPRIGSSTAN